MVPDTVIDLVEYFLETEALEIEYKIARCRPRYGINFQFQYYMTFFDSSLASKVQKIDA